MALIPSVVVAEREAGPGTFAGTVVSSETGAPVPSAELTFEESGVALSVRTGRDGGFRFQPPRPGEYRLAAIQASGFHPFGPEWGHSPISLHAREGQRVERLVFQLEPDRELTGVVLLPDGKPAAGATVRILDAGDAGAAAVPPGRSELRSADDGSFRFRAGDDALLEAELGDYTRARARVDGGVLAGARLQLRLGPPGDAAPKREQISGRVVDAAGVPAEGALVRVDWQLREDELGERDPHPEPVARVDAEGRFTVEGLDPGTYRVTATARGLQPAERADVRSGTRDLELRLGTGATLRGAVRDGSTGEPVSAFTVILARRVGELERRVEQTEAVLDSQGRFTLAGIGPGAYELQIAAFGYAASRTQALSISDPPADPSPVSVALGRGGRVFGTVLDDLTGKPIRDARIELEGGLGGAALPVPLTAMTRSKPDGTFELTGLAEGLRSVAVSAAGHHGRILSGLKVEPDGTIGPVEVRLTPTREGEAPRIELVGIGAMLRIHEDALRVGDVMPGGGAAEAGLLAGDEIVTIEGQPVARLGFEGSVNAIRGPENSSVTVELRRPPDKTVRTVVVPRRRIRG